MENYNIIFIILITNIICYHIGRIRERKIQKNNNIKFHQTYLNKN